MNDADRARAALHSLDAGCARDEWVRAGMAAQAAGLTFEDFDSWSATAANYDERGCRSAWKSFKPGGGIGPGTLFAMAREAGWTERANGHSYQSRADAPRKPQKPAGAPRFDVEGVWTACEPATPAHGYIEKKRGLCDGLRVVPEGASLRVNGQSVAGWLAVPLFDGSTDEPATLQFIGPDGGKLTAPGAMRGWFTVGGPVASGAPVYVCEGLGQAWSAHQATQAPAVVAFGLGRMAAVGRALAERGARVVLVADVGTEPKIEAAAKEIGCAWIAPPADLGKNGDINDLHLRAGLAAVAALLAQASEPEAKPPADDWPGSGDIGVMLRTEAPPQAWFAHERLLAGRAHVLAGMGGSSKTRALYHLGIGGVLGRLPWAWQIERTGSAALFLAEDTEEGVHRTLDAMARAMRLSDGDRARLAERLRVFPLAGEPSHLLLAQPGGALVESWRVARMLEILRTLPPPLVFVGLDPALGLTEGDEMNSTHQRRLGELSDRLAIELRACVVLNTHAAKGLQSLDEIGSHTSRGSGALTDAVRGEFVLRTMTAAEARQFGVADLEERKAHVQLVAVKGNELPPAAFVPVWLRRVAGGVLQSVELEAQELPAVGKRELDALAVLRKLAATAAPQLKDWRAACIAGGLVSGPTDRAREKAMERIRDVLLSAGLIERGIGRAVFVPSSEVPDMHKPVPDTDTP